ncbi:MAG: hypothetical protein IPP91_09785 [Betaproteobacteria bacterium]|nr:hypothetical protein [Betaproteobacteria bacterium]
MKPLLLALSVPVLLLADVSPQTAFGLGFVRDAAAIIGRPFTPMSFAGVARRTTFRFAAAETTAVVATSAAVATTAAVAASASAQQSAAAAQQSAAAAKAAAPASPMPAGAPPLGSMVPMLPAGCVTTPKGGVEYYHCAGVFYRPAFQSNNLVYVVVPQP